MALSTDERAMVAHAVRYITSDASIAQCYGVSERDVAAVRRAAPAPRKMPVIHAVPDASVRSDEAKNDALGERCEAHAARLWEYYYKQAYRWRLTVGEYCALVHSHPVNQDTVGQLKAGRERVVLGARE